MTSTADRDPVSVQERQRWFHAARFGMFIHWGLYAVPGRGEWIMFKEKIPHKTYARLQEQFVPRPGFAKRWAELAVEAGMKYMVLTARHHDGFCLFDSAVSDFTAPRSAVGRDLVSEYVAAARAAGLRVGLYYSLIDWRFPGMFEPQRYPDSAQAMVAQAHAQVRELMSNYGQIDLLWYDGVGWWGWPEQGITDNAVFWRAEELNRMVRQLQPAILINNRSGLPEDFDTPEGEVKASAAGRAWEACHTLAYAWGYVRHEPDLMTVPQLLNLLLKSAADEGNLLLNVGPQASGEIAPAHVSRLREMGRWLRQHEEAIRDSQRCALSPWYNGNTHLGHWTRRGNDAYLHLLRWPGPEFSIPMVQPAPRAATLLTTGEPAPFHYHAATGKISFHDLPSDPPDPYVTVLKLSFDAPPERTVPDDKAAWLQADAEKR